MKVEFPELLLSCLSRILLDEINNQKQWIRDDEKLGFNTEHKESRENLIKQCEEVRDQLEKITGKPKFYYYY